MCVVPVGCSTWDTSSSRYGDKWIYFSVFSSKTLDNLEILKLPSLMKKTLQTASKRLFRKSHPLSPEYNMYDAMSIATSSHSLLIQRHWHVWLNHKRNYIVKTACCCCCCCCLNRLVSMKKKRHPYNCAPDGDLRLTITSNNLRLPKPK